jgi:hypothetical protein
LNTGQSVQSQGLTLTLRGNGNLAVLDPGSNILWSTNLPTRACTPTTCFASFQGDGNLVLYMNGARYWASNTPNQGATALTFGSSSPYLKIINASGGTLWKPF